MPYLRTFITFEGGEGAGKSTQARLLATWLGECGFEVVLTREPGGSEGAERIRSLILTSASSSEADGGYDGLTEALLHGAARRDHCLKVILPALQRGAFVISDRFSDSTIAYQGYGQGVPLDSLTDLHNLSVPDGATPALTFLLDIAPEDGLARARTRTWEQSGPDTGDQTDRYERERLDFHHRVASGFDTLARDNPGRITRIDAQLGLQAAQTAIRDVVRHRYGLR